MTALLLVECHWPPKQLIGREVITVPLGEYPGGIATIVEIQPDPKAPEIVFQVKHPTFGEIGIFAGEPVQLVDRLISANLKINSETGGTPILR